MQVTEHAIDSPPRPQRNWRNWRAWQPEIILAASLLVVVLIAAIGGIALWQMRDDALTRARADSANLALTLERSISRNLQSYELSMHGLIDGIKDPEIMGLPVSLRQMVLFDRSINAEDLGSLLATDERGNLVLDSRSTPPRPVNVGDRDYFKVHQQSPKAGVFISRPFQPRMTAEGSSVGISRRLDKPDGSFAGIVVGTLRLNYFRRLFDGVDLGERGALTLLRTDGTILMRRPYDEASIGRDISKSASFAPLLAADRGTFIGKAAVDSIDRLYSYRHVPDFPLIVVVGLSMEDVLGPWRTRARVLGGLITVVDALIIALAVLLSRQWRRRMRMERHLRLLVSTDGLTGVGSRRALDDMADTEWRRAQRYGWPLSVLMLDVDYFKQFNDRYGHLAGDAALASVADCIVQKIRRPGDFAARYGGEEFAVLLPNTDGHGAAEVAQSIRVAVEAMRLSHADSEFGEITITIGIATADFADGENSDLRSLFLAADEALYLGKLGGRNCVSVSGNVADVIRGTKEEYRWAGAL
nr:sensor domain-containing diguanylate cyclase [uncultured Cupriavidus sp.]